MLERLACQYRKWQRQCHQRQGIPVTQRGSTVSICCGARFVHGGAMLQEICIPLVTVKELQKEQAAKHEQQPVGVVVASQPVKIVNNIDKIRFIQTDPVGGQFIARQLDIVILDEQGKEVSSRESVTFDSASAVLDERVRGGSAEIDWRVIQPE